MGWVEVLNRKASLRRRGREPVAVWRKAFQAEENGMCKGPGVKAHLQ